MTDQKNTDALVLFKQTVEKIRAEEKNQWVDRILDRYLGSSRTFCSGVFSAQDDSDLIQRTRDMVGGIPFTSVAYPWPRTPESDLHMQPLVQVNLSNASSALGMDLGEGLLQVWGGVYNSWDEPNYREPLFLRVVPPTKLQDAPSRFLPEIQPWLGHNAGNKKQVFFMDIQEEHPCFNLPLVQWQPAKPMFGAYVHLYNLLTLDEIDEMGGSDEYWPLAERIAEQVDTSELVIGGDFVYLGGLGGQAGGSENDPTFSIDLLLRLEDSAGFHMGVGMEKGQNGQWTFAPVMTIRAT